MGISWDSVKNTLAGSVPLIGTLLGGPAGGVVGSLVANALGVENTPDAIDSALKSDPSALVKLKELEFTHKTRLEEISLEDVKAHLADKQSARQREIEIKKAGGSTWPLYLLASIIVVGFFTLLIVLITLEGDISISKERYIFLMLGTLGTSFAGVVQYFFGSSKGSADKTKLLSGGSK